MIHPPSLLFPHGHFETTFPSAPYSSNCSRPESAGQAHFRTSAEEFRYLADPTHSTGYEPNEFDKVTSFCRRRPSTIRTTIASLTSRKPHARALDCSVFPQCLKPLFRKFLMVILFLREKAKKACLGKSLQDRERRKRRFCDQRWRADVKEKCEGYVSSANQTTQRWTEHVWLTK